MKIRDQVPSFSRSLFFTITILTPWWASAAQGNYLACDGDKIHLRISSMDASIGFDINAKQYLSDSDAAENAFSKLRWVKDKLNFNGKSENAAFELSNVPAFLASEFHQTECKEFQVRFMATASGHIDIANRNGVRVNCEYQHVVSAGSACD